MASRADLEKNGAAQAVLLSSAIAILTLAFVNLATEASEGIETIVQSVGSWMPGAKDIGSYSGKVALFLLAWLASWPFLHATLRAKQWPQSTVVAVFLTSLGLATTLLWPPMTHLAVTFLTRTDS
jgi:hypothetical protein